jgi:hypothetical protein
VILLDTSGLLAALDGKDPMHRRCADALQAANDPALVSPFVLAELDHLLRRRVGARAGSALLDQVANGAYELAPFGAEDIAVAVTVLARYADLDVGLTDASIVVLALRHRVSDVLTLDERHFRALRGPDDRPFRVLPADA